MPSLRAEASLELTISTHPHHDEPTEIFRGEHTLNIASSHWQIGSCYSDMYISWWVCFFFLSTQNTKTLNPPAWGRVDPMVSTTTLCQYGIPYLIACLWLWDNVLVKKLDGHGARAFLDQDLEYKWSIEITVKCTPMSPQANLGMKSIVHSA